TSAVARHDGTGECRYVHPKQDISLPFHEILISLAGLRRDQLAGIDPGGIGSDLRSLCRAVKARTGRDCTPSDVLNDEEVIYQQAFLDELLKRSGLVINRMANEIFDSIPNPVSGERLHAMWDAFEQTNPFRPSSKW